MKYEKLVDEENYYRRVDKFLRKNFSDIKLSSIYSLIRKGDIKVNGKKIKTPDHELFIDDKVTVFIVSKEKKDAISRNFEGKRKLTPTEMDIEVIYENDNFMAINKKTGVSIHPGKGERNRATLIEGLMYYGEKKGFEPFLVHRLDRNTSGVLIVAKNRNYSRILSEIISGRNIKKEYICMVFGKIEKNRVIDIPLDEKNARTVIEKVDVFGYMEYEFSLCGVYISTGRKHQIRRHLNLVEHPILGDERYGMRELNRILSRNGLKRPFLHCSRMSFYDEKANENIVISAPMAEDLRSFVEKTKKPVGGWYGKEIVSEKY